jgi:hypothetical protein
MLGAPAQAAPWLEFFGLWADHESSGEGRGKQDASSIRVSSARPGVPFDGLSQVQLGELPPGLSQHAKKVDLFPPGLSSNGEPLGVPPGLSEKGDLGWVPPGLSEKDDLGWVPPGLSEKDELPMAVPGLSPADEPVSAIPEPTGLLLFGGGLLLAHAVGRRRRVPSRSWPDFPI